MIVFLVLDYLDGTPPIKTQTYSHTANVTVIELTYLKIYPFVLINSFPPPKSHFIMVEADIHLRLLLTSMIDIYKVFELLACCLKGIWVHPCTITQAKVAPNCGMFGQLLSGNDGVTSWLMLISTTYCFQHT
jgi:hypothetical protein